MTNKEEEVGTHCDVLVNECVRKLFNDRPKLDAPATLARMLAGLRVALRAKRRRHCELAMMSRKKKPMDKTAGELGSRTRQRTKMKKSCTPRENSVSSYVVMVSLRYVP